MRPQESITGWHDNSAASPAGADRGRARIHRPARRTSSIDTPVRPLSLAEAVMLAETQMELSSKPSPALACASFRPFDLFGLGSARATAARSLILLSREGAQL